jgi:hypothetical protein
MKIDECTETDCLEKGESTNSITDCVSYYTICGAVVFIDEFSGSTCEEGVGGKPELEDARGKDRIPKGDGEYCVLDFEAY